VELDLTHQVLGIMGWAVPGTDSCMRILTDHVHVYSTKPVRLHSVINRRNRQESITVSLREPSTTAGEKSKTDSRRVIFGILGITCSDNISELEFGLSMEDH
jgi:hypothetical protein